MKTLAVIPARGGSKGIPRKNIRTLGDRPLLAYTIQAARGSTRIQRTVVSTDDPAIARLARRYGAEVISRPTELSGDEAPSESALRHALAFLRNSEEYQPDLLVFLQCTSPLTRPEDIDGTIETLLRTGADSALAVAPCHQFLWEQDDQGAAVGVNHDRRFRPRRQDRALQYLETGAVYVMRAPGFLAAGHRFFGKTVLHVIPRERCLEIDEPMDLVLAEALLKGFKGSRGRGFKLRTNQQPPPDLEKNHLLQSIPACSPGGKEPQHA
jgi:N-acylneuraminate cytidylyltransferase